MSLHSYSSVVKRIDKRGGPLEKYLAMHRRPMVLKKMSRPKDIAAELQEGVQELAVRTARCYQSFSNPVFNRSIQLRNAERFEWMRKYSLREFKYCVALQDTAAQFMMAKGGATSLASSVGTESVPLASSSPPQSATCPSCFVRNTDDNTYVDECSAAAAVEGGTTQVHISSRGDSPPLASFSSAALTSLSQAAEFAAVPVEHGQATASGACETATTARMTRAEAELALEKGEVDPTDLPFDFALEMLRPQQSVLDVLVNEVALQSDQLNTWFSRFCRRRVAWRVLHEHLLHLIRPEVYSPVVYEDTDIAGILQSVGNTVADIYAKLNVSDNELVIHLEEDPAILTAEPQAAFVSSSLDCTTRSCGNEACPSLEPPVTTPPASPTVYSVMGHLEYVFREILKNACVATVRWASDVSMVVRFAMDDRWVVVDFIDHAGGIAPEHMQDIWKFGWTTSEHYESHIGGFGVGLPTSKVFMDMWGGSINVYSTVGKGTTVRVRYPKAPTEVLVAAPSEEAGGFPEALVDSPSPPVSPPPLPWE